VILITSSAITENSVRIASILEEEGITINTLMFDRYEAYYGDTRIQTGVFVREDEPDGRKIVMFIKQKNRCCYIGLLDKDHFRVVIVGDTKNIRQGVANFIDNFVTPELNASSNIGSKFFRMFNRFSSTWSTRRDIPGPTPYRKIVETLVLRQ